MVASSPSLITSTVWSAAFFFISSSSFPLALSYRCLFAWSSWNGAAALRVFSAKLMLRSSPGSTTRAAGAAVAARAALKAVASGAALKAVASGAAVAARASGAAVAARAARANGRAGAASCSPWYPMIISLKRFCASLAIVSITMCRVSRATPLNIMYIACFFSNRRLDRGVGRLHGRDPRDEREEDERAARRAVRVIYPEVQRRPRGREKPDT